MKVLQLIVVVLLAASVLTQEADENPTAEADENYDDENYDDENPTAEDTELDADEENESTGNKEETDVKDEESPTPDQDYRQSEEVESDADTESEDAQNDNEDAAEEEANPARSNKQKKQGHDKSKSSKGNNEFLAEYPDANEGTRLHTFLSVKAILDKAGLNKLDKDLQPYLQFPHGENRNTLLGAVGALSNFDPIKPCFNNFATTMNQEAKKANQEFKKCNKKCVHSVNEKFGEETRKITQRILDCINKNQKD